MLVAIPFSAGAQPELPVEQWTGKTILLIGAHPDDDSYAMGTLGMLNANDNDVYIAILTTGNVGTQDPDLGMMDLAKIRKQEEQAALAAAGDAAPEEGLRGLVGAAQGFIGGIFRQGSKGGLGAATSSSAEEVDPRAGQREWLEQQAGAHEAADTDLAGAAAPPMKLGYHGQGREVFFADYGFR